MCDITQFKYIYEELRVFLRNLNKDNNERRLDQRVISKKLAKVDRIKKEFITLKKGCSQSKFSEKDYSLIIEYVREIDKVVIEIDNILKSRNEDVQLKLYINSSETNIKMEKFDLRTASSLLPNMDRSEDSVKQLIDAIELYNDLLDDAGKKLLTMYVLKTKLTQAAKLRLEKHYDNNENLIKDMKQNLLTRKSAAVLSSDLHNSKQGNKTVEQFGKSIEELMVNLTITQSNGNDDSTKILAGTNEKIALNVFSNGLRDNDVRTIIKARNFLSLKDAIRVAQDEENSKKELNNAHVFHVQNKFKGYRPQYKSNIHRGKPNNFYNNGHSRYFNSRNNNGYQSSRFRQNSQRNFHNRGKHFANRNQQRSYLADTGAIENRNIESINNINEPQTTQFFRAS